jgi:Tol biopolymer transport system component
MKKLLFSLLLIGVVQVMVAQKIHIVNNVQVPVSVSGALPVLSPTGEFILLTGGDMAGLQKFDLKTNVLSTVTTDKGAGFGMKISNDGSQVVFRNSFYKDKLRYTTLKSVDLQSGKESILIKSTRNLQGVSIADGTVLAVDNGKLIKKKLTGKTLSDNETPAVTSIKDGKLYVTMKNQTKLVTPAGKDNNYLWTSVSPDGKKMVYYVMETARSYVSNIDGSNPVSLGILRAPAWLGNDWIVGMYDTDDGHIVTSSQLFAVSANGKVRETLTEKSVVAMNPSGSADGTKLTYNTADGKIYLMNVITSK